MARIYNGFNALGLGQAINDMGNQRFTRNKSINDQFANGLGYLAQVVSDKQDDNDKKEAALALGSRLGIDGLTEMSGSMSGEDLAKYVLGYKDKSDDRKYAEGEFDRQQAAGYDDWLKKNNITNQQEMKRYVLGQLFGSLNANDVKDWGRSYNGVLTHNKLVRALKEYSAFDPELQNALEGLDLAEVTLGSPESLEYDDGIKARIDSIIESGNAEDIEPFLNELQKIGQLSYAQKNFGDQLQNMLRLADGKKLTNNLLTQQLLKSYGTVTRPQRDREQKAADKAADREQLWKQMEAYANDKTGTVAKPTVSKEDLEYFRKLGKANRIIKYF